MMGNIWFYAGATVNSMLAVAPAPHSLSGLLVCLFLMLMIARSAA